MNRPGNIVYPSGPILIQAVNINLDDEPRTITNWNTVYSTATNTLNLANISGSATGFNLQLVSGSFIAEDEGAQTDPFGRFPSSVLQWMLNSSVTDIVWKFTGLDATKNYRLKFAAVQSYNDPGDATTVVLNGTSYNLGGPSNANTVYPTTDIYYSVNLPSSGEINMIFRTTTGIGYACMNAMILEEWTP